MAASRTSIEHAAAEESTPLLHPSHEAPTVQSSEREQAEESAAGNGEEDDKPLPLLQITLLCFARVVDPICFFCIFPFVNQMIYQTGDIAETDVGFYSGLIESLFSVMQMFTMIVWGRLSDWYGRKPVLVASLIGAALVSPLFGFSKKVWQMILFRCLAGACSGTVVTIRTMVAELSTRKTQARAFSFFAFAGNVGIFIGPILGGGLSNLASHYPDRFGRYAFLRNHPYATPTLVTGILALAAAAVVFFFVDETLKTAESAMKKPKGPTTTLELLKSDGVPYVLYLCSIIVMQGFAYTALVPVFWFTSINLGGFGFDEREISLFLSITGVAQAIWLLVFFPPIQRRIGTGGVLRLCSWSYPFFYAVGPMLNQFLLHGWITAFWVAGPILLVIGSGSSMNFTAVQLAVNDVAPSPQTVGTLNALALTLLSAVRSIIPAATTTIFAIGVKKHILGGQLAWLVLTCTAVIMAVSLHWLPAKVEGKPDDVKAKVADEESSQTAPTYGATDNSQRRGS